MRGAALLLLFFLSGLCCLHSQTIRNLQSGVKTGIRGLSVVDDNVAWVSGSNGWTSVTADGGKTWKWKQVPGYEKFDFRDIEAFSATSAILVNAGSPAVILVTNDGGMYWKEVYRNDSPDIFLDGMDFRSPRQGIIYGDPIKGKMQLLRTVDAGLSWDDISDNLGTKLLDGEASFAASGTAIRTLKDGRVFIVTGGSLSRIFTSQDFGDTWKVFPCPIIQGRNSTGPFSIAFINKKKGLAVGGDYLADTSTVNNMLLTKNSGRTWQMPVIHPFGYRSSVEYLSPKFVITTGTSGTDISRDGGRHWERLTAEGFNTVRKAKSGSLVLLAGANGKISILESH